MPVIFITGATSGIGEATARLFASNKWLVVATGRRYDRLQKLETEYPDAILPIRMDVCNVDEVNAVVTNLPAKFKHIDVLLNNAGMALGVDPLQQGHFDEWVTMIDTNIKGLLAVTRAVLPDMIARNHGHIINIGSIAADNPYQGGNVYGGTKAFVKQLTRNLRCDLHGTNIRVTDVAPGLLHTEFTAVRMHGDEAANEAFYQGCEPLVADDIAKTIWFVTTLPEHVNINRIDIMPTCQHYGPAQVAKQC